MVNEFYQHGATRPRQHLEQPHTEPYPPILPARSRASDGVDAAAPSRILAVFVAHLATSLPFLAGSCRFLPPITPNVKLWEAANRLECGIREEDTPNTTSKSGKNGNVDHPSQLSPSAALSPTDAGRFRGRRPRGAVSTAGFRCYDADSVGFP